MLQDGLWNVAINQDSRRPTLGPAHAGLETAIAPAATRFTVSLGGGLFSIFRIELARLDNDRPFNHLTGLGIDNGPLDRDPSATTEVAKKKRKAAVSVFMVNKSLPK